MGRQDRSASRAVLLWVALPVVVAVGLLCAGVFGVILPAYGEGLLHQKREAIRQLTNSAHSILAGYRRRVRDGELGPEEARQRALRQIRRLRYGPAGKSYFWVHDLEHRMLMHPYMPELEQRGELSELTDRSGKRFIAEFVRVARERGGGYVRYDWQWQDDPNRIEPKLSYVRLFEPWGWVVGTGMYLDDVEAEIAAMTWRMTRIMVVIILSVGALLTVVATRAAVVDRRRVEAQRERARTEARYRALVDNASEGIALIHDGVLTFANDAMARLIERAPERLVGTPVAELLCDDEEGRRLALEVLDDDQTIVRERTRLKTASGGVREVFWSCGPVHTSDGEARILIVHDLTEQRQAERQLEISRSRLAAIYHNEAVGIAVIDPEGRFQQANDRWCRMLGYSERELVGRSFLDVTHADDREESRRRVEMLLEGEAWMAHGENRYVRKDGEVIWGDLSISAIRNGDDQVEAVVGMVVDVSERKSLEAQLIQSQKMEAVGQLAGGVAHDFNNQLTVIQGYASLLLRSLSEDDPRHEQVREVYQAGERSRRLTSQLLAFGRKQVLRAEPLNPCEVLEGLEQTLSRILGEQVRVVVRFGGEVSNINADRSQLEQAVINLAINARDAMPEGGTLTLEAKEDDVPAPRAGAAGIEPGWHVVIEATDTGVGMAPEVVEQIFEPFYTTKDVGEGTGLGLSMVYGFVRQSGGGVEVLTEPGKGSTFRLLFPRSDRAVAPDPQEGADRVAARSLTVLVAEDEQSVRSFIAGVLRQQGHDVLETNGARQAIEAYRMCQGGVDLLISDVVMPGRNGTQLARELRQGQASLGVILISGYDRGAAANENGDIPADAFLSKPFTASELIDRVAEVSLTAERRVGGDARG